MTKLRAEIMMVAERPNMMQGSEELEGDKDHTFDASRIIYLEVSIGSFCQASASAA
jgi:hypothetical protein